MADIMEKVGKYGPYALGAAFTGAAGAGIIENQRKLNEEKKEQDLKRLKEKEAKEEPSGSGKESLSKERNYKKGGSVSSASKRADGIATKGKTKGKIV